MAMTEEEFKTMQDGYTNLLKEVEQLKAGKPAGTQPQPTPGGNTPKAAAEEGSLLKQLEAKQQAEAEAARHEQGMKDAITFNLSAATFVEQNKSHLGDLAAKIVQEVTTKQFTSEQKKADCLRKNLLEDFFSVQKNIDSAPETIKSRIMEFKALADDEKEKRAGQYWDLLTLTVDRKALAYKLEQVNKANGGYQESDNFVKNYNDRVFAQREKYLGKKEQ